MRDHDPDKSATCTPKGRARRYLRTPRHAKSEYPSSAPSRGPRGSRGPAPGAHAALRHIDCFDRPVPGSSLAGPGGRARWGAAGPARRPGRRARTGRRRRLDGVPACVRHPFEHPCAPSPILTSPILVHVPLCFDYNFPSLKLLLFGPDALASSQRSRRMLIYFCFRLAFKWHLNLP